jgi:hypothetical protein
MLPDLQNIQGERFMSSRRTATILVATSIASMTLAFAQTPQSDTTSPNAASSPHQRDTTQANTPEAPAASGSDPSAASTPHQQQMTSHKRAMKDCVTKEQAEHTGMSMANAKKACKQQLKANSGK